jgi:hypothetical protein
MDKVYGNDIIKALEENLTNGTQEIDIQPETKILLGKQTDIISKYITLQNLAIKHFKTLMGWH